MWKKFAEIIDILALWAFAILFSAESTAHTYGQPDIAVIAHGISALLFVLAIMGARRKTTVTVDVNPPEPKAAAVAQRGSHLPFIRLVRKEELN